MDGQNYQDTLLNRIVEANVRGLGYAASAYGFKFFVHRGSLLVGRDEWRASDPRRFSDYLHGRGFDHTPEYGIVTVGEAQIPYVKVMGINSRLKEDLERLASLLVTWSRP